MDTRKMFDLTGKIALVTGSGQGLGFAIGRGLARAGATLVINDCAQDRIDNAVNELRGEGLQAHGYLFDVTKSEAVEAAVARIEAEVGPIDILVNNAGIQRRAPLEDLEMSDWQAVIDLNLTAPFICAKFVARGMIKRGRGKIINMCSLMSEITRPTTGPYTASKGGLKMLTKSMALEWGKHNIQVNGIGPGYFATAMTKVLQENPEFNNWICGRTPANRWGDPEELVGPAIFLSSDASSFVSGTVLYVDGGLLTAI